MPQTEVDNEERYVGEYSLNRHVLMTGVSKYDYPHITVTKEGRMGYEFFNRTNSTVADYTITVTNDGNRALAPVYVRDLFPPGTQYISSSYKPSALTATGANWTILHLGIGNSLTINLKLNITEYAPANLVNCVGASGITGDRLVSSYQLHEPGVRLAGLLSAQGLCGKEGATGPVGSVCGALHHHAQEQCQ